MTPKVSIVFTSYNHKKYLKQAVDSLLAQTFKEFELIIIDDCSTDGSQEILKSYTDPRIRLYLNEENSGSYVISTNYGASFANAPYIVFAQCDDWAEPNQIEILLNAIETKQVGVAFSCSNLVDESGKKLKEDFDVREDLFKRSHSVDSVILKDNAFIFLMNSCIIPNLSAAIIRRDLFENLKGFSNKYTVLADWDFWLRASSVTDFYYVREPLNNFRQHSTTIRSSIKTKKQLSELFDMMFSIGMKKNISKWKVCNHLIPIWINWIGYGKKEWIDSFLSMIFKGINNTALFPIAMIVPFSGLIFSIIINKIGRVV